MSYRFFALLLCFVLFTPTLGCGPATRTVDHIDPNTPEPSTDPAEMERLEKEMESNSKPESNSGSGGVPT